MNRKELPSIPISVRLAAGNVSLKHENEEFEFRRSQTLPAHLHSVERPMTSDASRSLVKSAVPPSKRRSSVAHAAREFPISAGEVPWTTTTPGNDSMMVNEETYGYERLSYVREKESDPLAQEQNITHERYSRPYVESVDSADNDVSGEKKAQSETRCRLRDSPKSKKDDERSLGNDAPEERIESHRAGVEGSSQGSMSIDPTAQVEIGEKDKAEICRRLKSAGFTADQIETAVNQEETENGGTGPVPLSDKGRPNYPKIHREYIWLETLHYYNLPWVYDRTDPNYIIILREMDKYETEVLFYHTERLRKRYWESKISSTRKEPAYAFYRKRDRTSSWHRKFGILELDDGEHNRLIGYEDYPLPIAPYVRDSDAGKPRDRDVEEATRRLDKDPGFNMQKCTDRCLSAVDHSCYVPYQQGEAYLLTLTERSVSADEDVGLFRRRYVPYSDEATNGPNLTSHLQLPELDFNKFRCGILELFEPRGSERLRILLHMEEVQRSFENRSVAKVGFQRIEPYYMKTSSEKIDIFSCCIPFFHLRQYGKLIESTPFTQRAQTLLQMRYSGADKQQDLRQVVCQKHGDQCLHVSYLWAIVINNETLVTASILSERELFQVSRLRIDPGSPIGSRSRNHPPTAVQYIRIEGPNDSLWLIERAQCRTWFEFALHLEDSDFALDEDTTVEYEGMSIKSPHWPQILEKTSGIQMKLRVCSHYDGPGSTLDNKDAMPLLEIDVESFRPIGSAIADSFVPSSDNGARKNKERVVLQAEQQHERQNGGSNTVEKEMEDYLKDVQLYSELSLYRDCRSMSFEELLAAMRQDIPKDKDGESLPVQDSTGVQSAMLEPTRTKNCHLGRTGSMAMEHSVGDRNGSQDRRGGDSSRVMFDGEVQLVDRPEATPAQVDSSTLAKADDQKHATHVITTVSSNGTEHPQSQHPDSLQLSDTRDTDQQQSTTPPQQALSDAAGDDLYDREDQSPEDSTSRRSLNPELLSLAEGVRALLYVFTENHDQRQLNECGRKLCGAIGALICRLDNDLSSPWDSDERSSGELRAISIFRDMRGLLNLARTLQSYQFGLNVLRSSLTISLPESFTLAMRSTTLAIIFANSTDTGAVEGDRISAWANEAERSLNDTFYSVLRSLQKPPLKSKAAARPKDVIASLARGVTGRILPDTLPDGNDLQGMYDDYIRTLEHEVRAEKPSRWPVKHLRNLRHELDAVHEQLYSQWKQLASLSDRLLRSESKEKEEREAYKARNSSEADHVPVYLLDGAGTEYSAISLMTAVEEASQRREQFETYQTWTKNLLDEAIAQTLDIDDWRNNAIVIFTIITIIFQPLSFVASVFGMNTADFRNMSHGQWLYWVSALPFTALVVAVTIWWSELLPIRRLLKFWKD